jgi:hypothetical protein
MKCMTRRIRPGCQNLKYGLISSSPRMVVMMVCIGAVLAWPPGTDSRGEGIMKTMNAASHGDVQPWGDRDPLQFLQTLKSDPQKVVHVFGEAPPGWIHEKHVDVLLGLLGSKEPASPVHEIKCPTAPETPSAVGKQAAFLLLGYVEDRYPPSGRSDLLLYSNDQVRRLTFERQRSQPMSPDSIAFSVARQELRRGESLRAKREHRAAIDAYFSGIRQLGDRYISRDIIDDTVTVEARAESEKAKGNLETAAILFHNVLESRVQAYRTHHPLVPD